MESTYSRQQKELEMYQERLKAAAAAGHEHLYFKFWLSYYEQAKEIPDYKMRCAFYEAIMRFGIYGEAPDFSGYEGLELACLKGMWQGAWPSLKESVVNFLNRVEALIGKEKDERPDIDPTSTQERPDIDQTSERPKEERKREKKEDRKEGESIGADAPAPSEDFLRFQTWIAEHAPEVAKMKQPFSEKEFREIQQSWPAAAVRDVLEAMSNKRTLTKDYVSAYKTCKSWLKRRAERQGGAGSQKDETTTRPKVTRLEDLR